MNSIGNTHFGMCCMKCKMVCARRWRSRRRDAVDGAHHCYPTHVIFEKQSTAPEMLYMLIILS